MRLVRFLTIGMLAVGLLLAACSDDDEKKDGGVTDANGEGTVDATPAVDQPDPDLDTDKKPMINAIIPGLNLRIGSLGRIRQGKHTTTHTQLVPVPGGGHVLDTPGIRSFGLQNLEPLDLTFCFPDIREFASKCAFRNCTHTVEPDPRGRWLRPKFERWREWLDALFA